MATNIFRANAGIAIIKDADILLFERADVPGVWQLPQGGIDSGEEPADAARRELYEETGLSNSDVELLGEYPEWLAYELPENMRSQKYRGQVQRWFVFRLVADENKINLDIDGHREFSNFRWLPIGDLETVAIEFRRPIYRKVSTFVKKLTQDT